MREHNDQEERVHQEPRIGSMLFGVFSTGGKLRVNSLDVEETFGRELLNLAQDCAARIANLTEIPYDATYRKLEGEYMTLLLNDAHGVEDAVSMMEAGPHPSFDIRGRGSLSGARFYAFKVVEESGSRWFFGRVSRSMVLGRDKVLSLIVEGGTKLQAIENDIIQLSRHVDFLLEDQTGYILHVQNFHYIFDFYEKLRRKTRVNTETLAEKVSIDNLDEFANACEGQAAMALKLHQIVTHSSFDSLPVDRLYKLIDEHDVPIETVERDGERKLVFNPDLRFRWLILRLIADDILQSPVTDRMFEATSKKVLPA